MADEIPPAELKCPECGVPYSLGTRHCVSCGALVVRECPACGADSPLEAARCLTCGQALEVVDELFARVTSERAGWLREAREQAPMIKAEAEADSQARLQAMWAEEARRQEELAQTRAEHDRQQRIIVAVTIGIATIVVLAVVLALVLMMDSPGP